MVIGAPVDLSLKTPLTISGISSSFLGVVPFVPPFLLSRSAEKSSTVIGIPGGQPSITTPTFTPCDSPKMLTLNNRPNEFIYFF